MSIKKSMRSGRKKRYIIISIVGICAITVALYNAEQSNPYKNSKTWNFDDYQPNNELSNANTNSTEETWIVKLDESASSKPNVLAKLANSNSTTPYHIKTLPDEMSVSNSKSSVKFKIIPEKGEQSAGLIIRFQDPDHYFVLVADALNNRFSLCRTEPNRVICTQDTNVNVTTGVWHTITAQVSKQGIAGYLDDRLLIQRYDQHYISGKIGMWAKGNSEVYFDDLKIDY